MGIINEIEQAYEAENLLPCFGDYFVERPEANHVCPMTAVAIHHKVASLKNMAALRVAVYQFSVKRWGKDWTDGFMVAYDGHEAEDDNPNYVLGHCAGSYVRDRHLEVCDG